MSAGHLRARIGPSSNPMGRFAVHGHARHRADFGKLVGSGHQPFEPIAIRLMAAVRLNSSELAPEGARQRTMDRASIDMAVPSRGIRWDNEIGVPRSDGRCRRPRVFRVGSALFDTLPAV